MSAHRVFRSGRLKPRAFLLPALIGFGTASSVATAATLASTSFQGSGLAYTLTGEFDAIGSGFTDYFKVLPNNATRVDSTMIPSGIFASGDGTQCLMTEDTDSLAATVPGTVTFAAVNLTGHTNIRLDVLLAATGVQGNALASPRGFEAGDRIKIEASVDGAAFQTLASFVPEAGGFNTYLSRDTDGNGTGDAGSPTAANAVETGADIRIQTDIPPEPMVGRQSGRCSATAPRSTARCSRRTSRRCSSNARSSASK